MSITFRREELFAEVWAVPLTTLARKYGLSDNGIRKVCKAMDIPLPKVGHWAKSAVGKAPPQPQLPNSAQRTTFVSNPIPKSDTPRHLVDEDQAWLEARLSEERLTRNKIVVTPKPVKWHPAVLPLRTWLEGCITKYQQALAEKARHEKSPKSFASPNFFAWDISDNDPVLGRTNRSIAMRVSLQTYGRALAIFNALAYAAAERGFKVELTAGNARLRLTLENANLDLYVTERFEAAFAPVLHTWEAKPQLEKELVPARRLCLNIQRDHATYQINQTTDSPLEGNLNRGFEYGYAYVIKSREKERLREIERQNAAIRQLQRDEAERLRKAEEQRHAEEQRRREELLQQAGGLDKAESIRSLVGNPPRNPKAAEVEVL